MRLPVCSVWDIGSAEKVRGDLPDGRARLSAVDSAKGGDQSRPPLNGQRIERGSAGRAHTAAQAVQGDQTGWQISVDRKKNGEFGARLRTQQKLQILA